jgi:hypothetical protein
MLKVDDLKKYSISSSYLQSLEDLKGVREIVD